MTARKSLYSCAPMVIMAALALGWAGTAGAAPSPALKNCQANLATCNTYLATCNTSLSQSQANLGTCNTDLSQSQANLATCTKAPSRNNLNNIL